MPNDDDASAEVFAKVRDLVRQLESGLDVPSLVHLLRNAALQLGADSAYYLSAVRDREVIASIRSLVACEPLWGLAHEEVFLSDKDPWLRYASRHSAPACGSAIVAESAAAGKMQKRDWEHGFASSFIVPIHGGGALPTHSVVRFGMLVIGSSSVGFFEHAATTTLRMLARSLAMELHEAYGLLLRQERIEWLAMSPRALDVLERARAGQSTKTIARALNTTVHSIDQFFWRIGKKLGARTRRGCVRLAVEYSLM